MSSVAATSAPPPGRLWIQPGPRGGRGGGGQAARRQGPRGEGPRDPGGPEDHGEHDQPGRRKDPVPDLLRLLRPAHLEGRTQVPGGDLPPCGRSLPGRPPEKRGELFRLYRRGPVCGRDRRGFDEQDRQARLRRGQTDPAGLEKHQHLHPRRPQGQPQGDDARRLHRRLGAAHERSRGHQRAHRSGCGRRHHARR